MRRLLVAALLAPTVAGAAEPRFPQSPREVPSYCQQREGGPVALLVTARDDLKTPRKELLAGVKAQNLSETNARIMEERVADVYDNSQLSSDTLWVFRANRCIEEFAHQSFVAYSPKMGAALLACQATHSGSMRELAQCVAEASDTNLAP